MNITFFIGNGFDLNLGLKTRYTDFYKYFEENAKENNMIRKWINGKERLWSDLEESLGKSLSKVDENNLDRFYVDIVEMENLLVEYLKKEEKKYVYNEETIKEELSFSIKYFDNKLPKRDKDRIRQYKENLTYNFVSFNYTQCLDRIVNIQKIDGDIVEAVGSDNTLYPFSYSMHFYLGDVYHIHGTVNEEMILGVNDESQIHNEYLKQNEEFCDNFIKVRINEEIGQQKTEEVKDLIDNSKIICLFGMSIGVTDKIWWEEIVKWLMNDKENLLVIYWRTKEDSNVNGIPYLTKQNNDKIKKMFLEVGRGVFNDEELDIIKKNIFVIFNDPELFMSK